MSRRLLTHSLLGLGLALSFGACTAPDFSLPCPIPPDVTDPNDPRYQAALKKCFPAVGEQPIDTRLKKDVDILFLVDNSTSMSPKQKVLATNIPLFIKKIDDTGANYHVGVITSDIGTLPLPGTPFPGSMDTRCNTPKGDDGLLQNSPCKSRTVNVSPEFTTACSTLCPDATFVPTDRWISKENGINNIAGHSSDPLATQKAFQCIGLVGDSGCGVESQLEATRRALDGHLAENKGFLRDNSVLAVIFITDEDDCSVQLAQRANLNPTSMPCGTSSSDPNYTCYNLDYRCIAKDLQCNEAMNTPGAKTGCKERTNTFLEPIEKYVRFFSALRTSDKLVMAGIWSPSLIDYYNRNSTGDGQLVIDADPSAPTDFSTNLINRGQKTKAACYNPDSTLTTDPKGFFGQAQYRLQTFKNKFDPTLWSEQSICDAANYSNALNNIADKIQKKLTGDCLSVDPNLDGNGNPVCLVGFVDANQQNALPDTYLPVCSKTCCNGWGNSAQPTTKDPGVIAACTAEAADCYCAVPSTQSLCTGTVVAGVWRAGNADPPNGKVVNFRCAGTRPAVAPSM